MKDTHRKLPTAPFKRTQGKRERTRIVIFKHEFF
jgi:hypothetical protein